MTATKETITRLLEVRAFKELNEVIFTNYASANYVKKEDASGLIDDIVKMSPPFSELFPAKTNFVSSEKMPLIANGKAVGSLRDIKWYIRADIWQDLITCSDFAKIDSFSQMWEAYKEAAEKNDGFRDTLDVVLDDRYPEPDVWFVTPHDLQSSRSEKTIGYQLERSGWSDYEEG